MLTSNVSVAVTCGDAGGSTIGYIDSVIGSAVPDNLEGVTIASLIQTPTFFQVELATAEDQDFFTTLSISGYGEVASADATYEVDGGTPSWRWSIDAGWTDLSEQTLEFIVAVVPIQPAILVWDYKKNIIRFENHGVQSLFTKNNSLLGITEDLTVQEFYAAETDATVNFRTGWLGEGGLLAEKVQDRIRICYKGDLTLNLYADEALVATKSLSSATVDILEFKLPRAATRNNFIEFELLGAGAVYEISNPQEDATR